MYIAEFSTLKVLTDDLDGMAMAEIPTRLATFASRTVEAENGDHDEILNDILYEIMIFRAYGRL